MIRSKCNVQNFSLAPRPRTLGLVNKEGANFPREARKCWRGEKEDEECVLCPYNTNESGGKVSISYVVEEKVFSLLFFESRRMKRSRFPFPLYRSFFFLL